MAPGLLAPPGQPAGPCIEPCQHRDCAATRQMAETVCHYCGKPIGYDRGFYDHEHQLVHSACLEEMIERR